MAKSRIAVIEDDLDIRGILQVLLEEEGCDVLCFASAEEALEALPGTPPDVICLDLRMPGMDGYGFRRVQRSLPALAAIPVVVMTAEPNVEALVDVHLIRKPFEPDQLLALVAQLQPGRTLPGH